MNSAVTLTKHALCILLLSKKCHNFSDSLTMGINILICLFSNSVLIFSNELGKLCFTREHLFSIRLKFQLKIYNTLVSILKISTNNNLLRVYCHYKFPGKRRWTPKKNPTLKIARICRIFKLKCSFLAYGHLGLLIYSRHIILLKRTRKMPKLALFACSHEFTSLETPWVVMFTRISLQI